MRKARKGTNVIYIPGNHDEAARQYCQLTFGEVKVEEEAIHTQADGRKLLVIHGDQFDGIVRYARWLAILGDWAYSAALRINTTFNWGRRKLGLPYWSLSAYLKHKVKNAVQFIDNYEHAVASEARRRGVDGVVCGHIHHAEIRNIDGILYCNDGDWVESCTALVEDFDGPPAHRALGRGGGAARRHAAASGGARAHGGGVAGLRIAIVSDAWRPQINGVVRTIETVAQLLRADGHDVEVFGPDRFRTLPCPTYPEIRLSLFPGARLAHMLKLYAPDAIHLVTEGPLGLGGAQLLPRPRHPLHHRLSHALSRIRACPHPPAAVLELRLRAPLPCAVGRGAGGGAVDPRRAHRARLQEPGAVVARRRHRGLPAAPAQPRPATRRPIWLYAGRVAIEKNIKAFLDLDLPGTKWVVGGGPQLKELQAPLQGRALLRLGRHRGAVGRATPRPTASSSPAAPTRSAW